MSHFSSFVLHVYQFLSSSLRRPSSPRGRDPITEPAGGRLTSRLLSLLHLYPPPPLPLIHPCHGALSDPFLPVTMATRIQRYPLTAGAPGGKTLLDSGRSPEGRVLQEVISVVNLSYYKL